MLDINKLNKWDKSSRVMYLQERDSQESFMAILLGRFYSYI